MKYKIEYLPAARKDLADIFNYIADNLEAPKAAMDLLDAFDNVIGGLEDFPYAYRVYNPLEPLETEYRLIPIKNYAVFYTVDERKKRVEIQRIVYAKMDITKIAL